MLLVFYGVVGVAVIVGVAVLAPRLGVAGPVVLVVVGVGMSYVPGSPHVEVPPEWVLVGVLPPILYAAAIRVPVIDLRRNLDTIASLSIVLVLVTALVVGFVLYALLPQLGLALAIAFGAVISPTDAVAATSVGRRLGLPPRLLTVLEGEGLMNDATALVLLGSATAVAAGGQFSLWTSGVAFVYSVVIAVAAGLAIGFVTVAVRSKLTDAVLDTAVSIAVPFAAFAAASALGGSGVLAVVIAGLYTGRAIRANFSARTRTNWHINWSTIQFLLESAVFLLIGLELRSLVEHVGNAAFNLMDAVGIGLVTAAGLVVVRFLWMGPLLFGIRLRVRHAEKAAVSGKASHRRQEARDGFQWGLIRFLIAAPQHRQRREADREHLRREEFTWRGAVLVGWAGMRGVVTLAAAQSLPSNTPYRPQLVLIAFTITVVTLVVQGGTLPLLIRVLRVQGSDPHEDQKELAELLEDIAGAGLAVLNDPTAAIDSPEEIDPAIVERVRQEWQRQAEAAREGARGPGVPLHQSPHRIYRRLMLSVLQAERDRLLTVRRQGTYSSRAITRAQTLLDVEETRLQTPEVDR